jgi:1-acyl-sn-glycerol-3-phosphate acyltransferase
VTPHAADAVHDRDFLITRLVATAGAFIEAGYFSFEVEGLEHLPADGRVVYAANHSGWFPLDAFFLTKAVVEAQGLGRAPFFATHDAAMAAPGIGPFLRRFGAVPASWFRRPERLPPEIECCGIFPEGVRGNTKPFWEAYRMREWNRGFVRVAIAREAPIVSVAILGGEECLPVAWTLKLFQPWIGATIGLPLSVVPLPSRWKIVFHRPVEVAGKGAVTDQPFCSQVARDVQAIVQATLDRTSTDRLLAKVSSAAASVRRTR